MAVDRGYGSGKPRSAANSSMRRRAAAGQRTKRKLTNSEQFDRSRKKLAASPIGQIADTLLGFALPVGKVKAAAAGLRAAGKIGKAAALEARIAAKVGGQIGKRASAIGNAGRGPFSAANFAKENAAIKSITNRDITAAGARAASESLFPKLPNMGYVPGATRTFDRYADPLLEGAGRLFPGIAKKLPKPKLPKGRGGR